MSVKLREKQAKNGISLYLDIYNNGKRSYEFLKIKLIKPVKNSSDRFENKELKRLAKQIRANREIEILNGNFGFSPEFKKHIDIVAYTKKIIAEKNLSKDQFYNWQSLLKHLENFLDERKVALIQIDEHLLKGFKEYLLKELSQNTAANYFNKLRSILKLAINDQILVKNPFLKVSSINTIDSEREYLTFDELEKIAKTDCENLELKRAFLFSCYTGLRWSDIAKLTWGDIKNNTIRFRPQKTDEKFLYIPLNLTAKRLLGEQVDSRNNIFNIKYSAYENKKLQQWIKDSGIKKHITFHCARHTFATLALTNGADLYVIQKLLGHSEIKTTAIYTKIIDEKKSEAVNCLPQIEIKL